VPWIIVVERGNMINLLLIHFNYGYIHTLKT